MERLCGLRVLVVDDDEDVLGAIADILTIVGCEVDTAMTLGEARAKVAWTRPALVMCDWNLGGGERSGPFLSAIACERPSVARVLVTGSARSEWKALVDAGIVQHFIVKPFDAHDLVAAAALMTTSRQLVVAG
jgi:DNA-binding NtrC family response regulator